MSYGSEPDPWFERNEQIIATIEIRRRRDPAEVLEPLGAMDKSFEKTPLGCTNFLVAGVTTEEMKVRLYEPYSARL